jgi:hypothetical protein
MNRVQLFGLILRGENEVKLQTFMLPQNIYIIDIKYTRLILNFKYLVRIIRRVVLEQLVKLPLNFANYFRKIIYSSQTEW